jgi:hypothetical protein
MLILKVNVEGDNITHVLTNLHCISYFFRAFIWIKSKEFFKLVFKKHKAGLGGKGSYSLVVEYVLNIHKALGQPSALHPTSRKKALGTYS